MKPPNGVLKPGQEGMVCQLKKALYGLKQSGHEWHQRLSDVMLNELGFSRSEVDNSVFYKHEGETHMIIPVATDDMAVMSKHMGDVIKFKSDIQRFFDITDNGELKWFLNCEVQRN